jgi:hypothetical protein
MVTARIRKFNSKTEMERTLDEYITMGYRVREQGENTILVRKHDNGSSLVIVILAVFTWWLLEIPTILYVWYKRTHADTILMKMDEAGITVQPVEPIASPPVR